MKRAARRRRTSGAAVGSRRAPAARCAQRRCSRCSSPFNAGLARVPVPPLRHRSAGPHLAAAGRGRRLRDPRPSRARAGLAFAVGGNPFWCAGRRASCGARHAVAEAARNVACAGARPWALTDCLNFGHPEDARRDGRSSRRTLEGLAVAARRARRLGVAAAHPLPFVSGNVSLYNQSGDQAVPPSPIVMCAGVLRDAGARPPGSRCCGAAATSWCWSAIRATTSDRLGVSSARCCASRRRRRRRSISRARRGCRISRCVAAEGGWVRAAHDVSDGGLAVALAEMLMAAPPESALGIDVDLGALEAETVGSALFCERAGDRVRGESGARRPPVPGGARALAAGVADRLGEVRDASCALLLPGGTTVVTWTARAMRDARPRSRSRDSGTRRWREPGARRGGAVPGRQLRERERARAGARGPDRRDLPLDPARERAARSSPPTCCPAASSYRIACAAGALAAKDPLVEVLAEEAERGKPVLGICNGAQVLVEAGLVPGGGSVELALARNRMPARAGYYARWVYVRVESSPCVFTRHLAAGTLLPLPVAHGEGRFAAQRSGRGHGAGARRTQAPLRYASADGRAGAPLSRQSRTARWARWPRSATRAETCWR